MEEKIRFLAQILINGDLGAAKEYLSETERETENKEYAASLSSVMIMETVKYIEKTLQGIIIGKAEIENVLFEAFPDINTDGALGIIAGKMKSRRNKDCENLADAAVKYIENNIFDHQLSLNNAADFMSITPTALSRAFAKTLNITPSEYICRKRIIASLDLLKRGLSVNETADRAGFVSPATFIRAFKRRLGVTPGKYMFMNK